MFPKKLHLTCKNKYTLDNNNIWKNCFEKYKTIYYDYKIVVYDDNDIYNIVNHHFPNHFKIIKNINNGAILADIFRYLILYLEGGVYSDMDCEPIKPLDTLINDIHYHGDKNRNNLFFIYNLKDSLLNPDWDFYKNPCDSCCLISKTDIYTYKCLGHKYVNKETNTIVCKEFFEHPEIFKNEHNNYRLCQWFIITKPKQQIFLDSYIESINNIKNRLLYINQLKYTNPDQYFLEVVSATGPIMFTKIINKTLKNDNICILPSDFFCSGSGCVVPITRNSYIKHHFTSVWTK